MELLAGVNDSQELKSGFNRAMKVLADNKSSKDHAEDIVL